jgi:hypothetical protein
MNDKTLTYISLGVAVTTLIVVVILAQHLNETADSVDKGTQGLLGNAKVQSVLTSVSSLFGGGK